MSLLLLFDESITDLPDYMELTSPFFEVSDQEDFVYQASFWPKTVASQVPVMAYRDSVTGYGWVLEYDETETLYATIITQTGSETVSVAGVTPDEYHAIFWQREGSTWRLFVDGDNTEATSSNVSGALHTDGNGVWWLGGDPFTQTFGSCGWRDWCVYPGMTEDQVNILGQLLALALGIVWTVIGATGTDQSPVFISSPVFVTETGTTEVGTVLAVDPEGAVVFYTISGGPDAAKFLLNPVTGELSFLIAPDFSSPGDANADNIYEVTIEADDTTSDPGTQNVLVMVVPVENQSPYWIEPAARFSYYNVEEGTTFVTDVDAVDLEGDDPVTYSITGGPEADKFEIDSTTGVVSFKDPAPFPAEGSFQGTSIYQLQVSACDSLGNCSGSANEAVGTRFRLLHIDTRPSGAPAPSDTSPIFTSPPTFLLEEGNTEAGTVEAFDPESQPITYTISGGLDAADFTIHPTNGTLTFNVTPVFASPHDSDTDNTYEVTVQADDGTSTPTTQDIQVIVIEDTGPENNPPVFVDPPNTIHYINVEEGETFVYQVLAIDAEGDDPVTYFFSGQPDDPKFHIDSFTGVISFKDPAPYPAGGSFQGIYRLFIGALDSAGNQTQSADQNPPGRRVLYIDTRPSGAPAPPDTSPIFTSSSAFLLEEGNTEAGTVEAFDPESQPITYTITGGLDAADFTIHPVTGVLTFNVTPVFASPHDSDTDNTYEVTVQADDGTSTPTTQDIQVIVIEDTGPENQSPYWIDPPSIFYYINVEEGTTFVYDLLAIDPEGTTVTYFEHPSGPDSDLNKLSTEETTGVITFDNPAPYPPQGSNPQGFYLYRVQACDADGNCSPVGSSDPQIDIRQLIIDTRPSGAPAPPDQSPFFATEPLFIVEEGNTEAGEVLAIDPENQAIIYTIIGGDDASDFTLQPNPALPQSRILTFNVAPSVSSPHDANADNVYEVTIRADDSTSTPTTQDISVLVISAETVNQPPVFTNPPSRVTYYNVEEGETFVVDVDAVDPEGDDPVTYFLQVNNLFGTDNDKFQVDPTTGVVSFKDPAPYPAEGSFQGTTNYSVYVEAIDSKGNRSSGGTASPPSQYPRQLIIDTRPIVTPPPTDVSPIFTSQPGFTVQEGNKDVGQAEAFDPESQPITYSISGGPDAADFTIDPSTGVIEFLAIPNYVNPHDADQDNVYEFTIQATDGTSTPTTQDVTVTVTIDPQSGADVWINDADPFALNLQATNLLPSDNLIWEISLPNSRLITITGPTGQPPLQIEDSAGTLTASMISGNIENMIFNSEFADFWGNISATAQSSRGPGSDSVSDYAIDQILFTHDGTGGSNGTMDPVMSGQPKSHVTRWDWYGNGSQVSTGNTPTATLGSGAGSGYVEIVIWSFRNLSMVNDGIKTVTFPNSLKRLGQTVLSNNSITSITLPNQLIILGTFHCQGNSLTTLTIPGSVSSITTLICSDNAITSLTIPNAVSSMVSLACDGNSISSLVLSTALTSIGTLDCFDNVLTSLSLPSGLTTLTNLYCYDNSITSLTIPSGVTSMNILDCSSNTMTSLTLPSGMTTLQNLFCDDNSLTSLTIPTGITTFSEIRCQDNSLTSLTLPGSLTSFGDLYANNNSLTSLTIPSGTTSFDYLACNVNSLTSLSLPSSLVTIDELNCSSNSLTSLTLPSGLTSLNTLRCNSNSITSLTIPNGVTTMLDLLCNNNSLTSMSLGTGLTDITGQLNADSNSLGSITGLGNLDTLDIFTVRNNALTSTEVNGFITTVLGSGVTSGLQFQIDGSNAAPTNCTALTLIKSVYTSVTHTGGGPC